MRILVVFPLLIVLSFCPSAVARAGWPDYAPSEIQAVPGDFYMVPSGSVPSLEEQGVGIELWLRDANQGPVAGLPAQDLWLEPETGELSWCVGGNIADASTDAEGYTTFRRALAGGGWTESGLVIRAAGEMIPKTPYGSDYVLDLRVNSPDINGDLQVDLGDISLFAEDLASYHFRSDYDHDGQVNLSDIAILASWIGDRCP
jgi:hypothetical protein